MNILCLFWFKQANLRDVRRYLISPVISNIMTRQTHCSSPLQELVRCTRRRFACTTWGGCWWSLNPLVRHPPNTATAQCAAVLAQKHARHEKCVRQGGRSFFGAPDRPRPRAFRAKARSHCATAVLGGFLRQKGTFHDSFSATNRSTSLIRLFTSSLVYSTVLP